MLLIEKHLLEQMPSITNNRYNRQEERMSVAANNRHNRKEERMSASFSSVGTRQGSVKPGTRSAPYLDEATISGPSGSDHRYGLGLRLHARRELKARHAPPRVLEAAREEVNPGGLKALLALLRLTYKREGGSWINLGRSVAPAELAETGAFDDEEAARTGLEALRDCYLARRDPDGADRFFLTFEPDPPCEDPSAYDPFPGELWRVPVPNEVFELLPGLTGSAARALLLMIRATFHYDPEGGWGHGKRAKRRKELERVAEGDAGITGKALRNGLRELERRGLVEIDRGGRSNRYWLNMEPVEAEYTWLPTSLIDRMGELSTKALRVLLSIYRGTWGWTRRELRDGSPTTVHKRAVQLSAADLQRYTGLSAGPVRDAIEELMGTWIDRGRPSAQAAYIYTPLPSVLADAEKSEGETLCSSKRVSSNNKRARDSSSEPRRPNSSEKPRCLQGRVREEGEPFDPYEHASGEAAQSDWKEIPDGMGELYERLRSNPIEMDHGPAIWCLTHRSQRLIEASLTLLRESEARYCIENRAGWLFAAIRDSWAAPLGSKEGPSDRRKRTSRRKKKRYSEGTDLGSAVRGALGVGSEEPPGWTWEEARRILKKYRLLDRMPDLSHWFDVVSGKTGKRYVPTKETKRLLD